MNLRLLSTLTALLVSLNFTMAGPRDDQWKKVDEAISKGLPKSAIEALDPIITAALKDKAWAEATRAITRKISLEGTIQGNKPEEKIYRLHAELRNAPRELQPVLETVLGHWYWHYFQQNRWRFMQRTATATEPGKDFTTWDLTRLFVEIDRHYTEALSAADYLKTVPVAAWDDLLVKGTVPDTYRPTLYDFLANEALEFYSSGEQAAAKPEDAFEPAADSPVLGTATEFLAWRPATTDTNSPVLKAIGVYQALMRFHVQDADRSAFLDADLHRLLWASGVAGVEGRTARLKTALEAFARSHAEHELGALARYHWAQTVETEGDLVVARQIASEVPGKFRDSPGGRLCRNLISQIESRSLEVATERVWNGRGTDTWPKIDVTYRNLTKVYFRAIAYDWAAFLARRRNRPEALGPDEWKEVLSHASAFEWTSDLPPTADFKPRIQSIPGPAELKPGFYFIVASANGDFTEQNNVVSGVDVWVSDLALVLRPRDGQFEGFVLEAQSGEPIAGALIEFWALDRTGERVPQPSQKTDADGFFRFPDAANRNLVVRVRHEGRELGSNALQTQPRVEPLNPEDQTMFFPDRAIYRPGQTIQYKGLCIHVDQERDDYRVLPDRDVTVVFVDPNNKEIARNQHRVNSNGSFAGSFTAPRGQLLGQMWIRCESPVGQTFVRVEEYKRPKFHVALDAPKVAARLNEAVTLAGHALAYTGAAIDGAPVKWRVTRQVRWPWWWGWWRPMPSSGAQEIAHGTAVTGVDGAFEIQFTAHPDPQAAEKDEPTFSFAVNADVTDSTGETRSAERTINVGFIALEARMSADDWQTDEAPVKIDVTTKTLDGEPQSAEGVVKIHRLQPPETVQRPKLAPQNYYRWRGAQPGVGGDSAGEPDLSDPNQWPLGDVAFETAFTTDKDGKATVEAKLPPGAYRAMLETKDRFGKAVTGRLPIRVLRPADTKFPILVPHLVAAPKWSVEPGGEFMAVWGTGYESGRAFIEFEHRGRMIEHFWTKPGQTQQQVRRAVSEAMRGGFQFHITRVRENRSFTESHRVDVPWSNKELTLKWEHFTSKLQPGQKESWTVVIGGPKAQRVAAEMVATLYDASLDQFVPYRWPERFSLFREDYSRAQPSFLNFRQGFRQFRGRWEFDWLDGSYRYRNFPPEIEANLWGYGIVRTAAAGAAPMPARAMADNSAALEPRLATRFGLAARAPEQLAVLAADKAAVAGSAAPPLDGMSASAAGGANVDLSKVAARKNLNETAFFFPQLTTDSDGAIQLQFTLPEALTEWHFMGFAHDRECRSGFLEGKTVTAKDLMVQPNPPRFLREGDTLEFTVKVSNQSEQPQHGKVRLTFNTAADDQSADAAIGNTKPEQPFDIPAKESRSFSWRIHVPDGLGFLTYKTVGASETVSDGEEGFLPVLSRRVFLTESLPLPIRDAGTKKFQLAKLLASGKSSTIKHESVTVQMVSNPAWYAVMALPYLMEYPHECAEQTFNRLYANALARHLANSDPKIHRVFEQWRGTPALDSPLEKNQDLKSVLIEETPWLRQGRNESQARRNVGVLFDDNRLDMETAATFEKLAALQIEDGAWPWFPGGPANDYITLYIVTGFGRMRHLGVEIDTAPAIRAVGRLDGWVQRRYRDILERGKREENHLDATVALYLYGRSFFLKDHPVAPEAREAVDYFLGQGREFWLRVENRQSQGHLALALLRFGDSITPTAITKSLKERSMSNEELGMFWRDDEYSWWWYRAPIETQALMIEAFDEVAHDSRAVEDLKVWLLKQKQTQDWKTTKATADAVYALLLRGHDLLASDALVEMKLDGIDVTPQRRTGVSPTQSGSAATPKKARKTKSPTRVDTRPDPGSDGTPALQVEAGTGFYERRFAAGEVKPKMGEVILTKRDAGVAWGAIHWQYFEDLAKVTPHEGTPLKLNKALFKKTRTKAGAVLEAVKGPVAVGDELVVRLELRVDRDMEYIHLKDQRGSGVEPVNVLSSYRYQDGLGYYESTRDTASHFFIDYLPKGTYVFEYSARVQHRGEYQSGLAEIQCLYAPEFNSHSGSVAITVK